MSKEVIEPSLTNNPGRIRFREVNYSSTSSQSLAPGQPLIIHNIPHPTTTSDAVVDTSNLSYLRLGPTIGSGVGTLSDEGSTAYSRTLKVVPEPHTVTRNMLSQTPRYTVLGNSSSANADVNSLTGDILTRMISRFGSSGGSNYIGENSNKFNSGYGLVDGGSGTTSNWLDSRFLNQSGTWTNPLSLSDGASTAISSSANSLKDTITFSAEINNNVLQFDITHPATYSAENLRGTLYETVVVNNSNLAAESVTTDKLGNLVTRSSASANGITVSLGQSAGSGFSIGVASSSVTNATNAARLSSNKTIIVDLSSDDPYVGNLSGNNITIGVNGTIDVSHGGTGISSSDFAYTTAVIYDSSAKRYDYARVREDNTSSGNLSGDWEVAVLQFRGQTASSYTGHPTWVTQIGASGSSFSAGYFNSVYTSSDIRRKENISDYDIGNKSIIDIPIHKYDYIKGDKDKVGWIAQEVKEIFPDLVVGEVSEENPEGYLNIDTSRVVFYLIAELKKYKAAWDKLLVEE